MRFIGINLGIREQAEACVVFQEKEALSPAGVLFKLFANGEKGPFFAIISRRGSKIHHLW